MNADLTLEKKKSPGVPAILYILIIAILAGMYYYAAFVLFSDPEKVVSTYYEAYFSGDYQTVAENLSVFQSSQALPQYANLSPSQLMAERSAIEDDMAFLLAQEQQGAVSEGLTVELIPEYTRKGESSGIAVYKILKDGKQLGMEAAILIMENNRLRIFQTTPINQQSLAEIKKLDMKQMDKNLQVMLAQ